MSKQSEYAIEKLVAEMGKALLYVDLQITLEIREDHAAHIRSWRKVLKDENHGRRRPPAWRV